MRSFLPPLFLGPACGIAHNMRRANTNTKVARAHGEYLEGRARFGEIVAEFWGPKNPSRRAVILLDGCPSLPQKRKLATFLTRKGFWVFHPRYRGSWESRGRFLSHSPHEDALLVADAIQRPFQNISDGTRFILDIEDVSVVGTSFGGASAILASVDPRIDRAIAVAPVVDWRKTDKEGESIETFVRILEEGFPGAYRLAPGATAKLRSGKFYAPLVEKARLSAKKLFVIHDPGDCVVPFGPTHDLVHEKRLPHLFPRGLGRMDAHLSSSVLMQREVWKKVKIFLG